MVRDDTVLSIALDDDDTKEFVAPRSVVSIAPREDSLGAKYNRAQQQAKADLYVIWADDMVMPENGWDQKLHDAAELFTDGIGVIYFGFVPNVFQPGIAVTHGFVEAAGYFNVPYFSYWWAGDTWNDEIARFCDRIVHADVKVELLDQMQGKSRGVRDIAFWAEFFDTLRPDRMAIAERIIAASAEPPYRKMQLRQRMPGLAELFRQRNSKLRDPKQAADLERYYGFDNEETDRYFRLKNAAAAILAGRK